MTWNDRIDAIQRSVFRRSRLFCAGALGVYVPGSMAILVLIPDKSVAALAVMVFFQVLAIIGFTLFMFPYVSGAFRVGLEANRDMLGTIEKLGDLAETGNHPTIRKLEDVALAAAADMKAVRVAIEERTKPLPVHRRPDNGEKKEVASCQSP